MKKADNFRLWALNNSYYFYYYSVGAELMDLEIADANYYNDGLWVYIDNLNDEYNEKKTK